MSTFLASEFPEYLRRARSGDAPVTRMRMRHWTVTRRTPTERSGAPGLYVLAGSGKRYEEPWVALYPADAEPGSLPVVVLPVRPDPEIDHIAQGAEVTVWGWPVVGGAVHLAHGELPLTATGPCDLPMRRRKLPRL